jgi:hypothetical protein
MLQVGGLTAKIRDYWVVTVNYIGESKTKNFVQRLSDMKVVEGFCLKCKTYGPIKDGQLIKMKNGRTRMAGSCSQIGCTGRISKIVS